MAYKPGRDVTAGNISIEHGAKLQQIMAEHKRKKRATVEWLIDQEHDKLNSKGAK